VTVSFRYQHFGYATVAASDAMATRARPAAANPRTIRHDAVLDDLRDAMESKHGSTVLSRALKKNAVWHRVFNGHS
jgi:hypothetical protein